MTILSSITEVFHELQGWLISSIRNCTSLFYSTEDGLTLLGILSVMALGISVFFLIMRVIQNFLHFRG